MGPFWADLGFLFGSPDRVPGCKGARCSVLLPVHGVHKDNLLVPHAIRSVALLVSVLLLVLQLVQTIDFFRISVRS